MKNNLDVIRLNLCWSRSSSLRRRLGYQLAVLALFDATLLRAEAASATPITICKCKPIKHICSLLLINQLYHIPSKKSSHDLDVIRLNYVAAAAATFSGFFRHVAAGACFATQYDPVPAVRQVRRNRARE